MGIGMAVGSLRTALVIHAVAAPLIFAFISAIYFRRFAYTNPLVTAVLFIYIVVLMDLVVIAMLIQRSFEMFTSLVGTWLPFASIFGSTYLTGVMVESSAGVRGSEALSLSRTGREEQEAKSRKMDK